MHRYFHLRNLCSYGRLADVEEGRGILNPLAVQDLQGVTRFVAGTVAEEASKWRERTTGSGLASGHTQERQGSSTQDPAHPSMLGDNYPTARNSSSNALSCLVLSRIPCTCLERCLIERLSKCAAFWGYVWDRGGRGGLG